MRRARVGKYEGQSSYRVKVGGLVRELPVIRISPRMWIASNAELILGDVEFLSTAAKLLAGRLRGKRIDLIVTAEAKSISLAYAIARELGHPHFVIARKSVKAYMGEHLSQRVKSITTTSEQSLIVTKLEAERIRGRRACILDDVVSTGATLKALEALVRRSGGIVACRAALWREGPWYKKKGLVYLDTLPVFVDEGLSQPETTRGPNRKPER